MFAQCVYLCLNVSECECVCIYAYKDCACVCVHTQIILEIVCHECASAYICMYMFEHFMELCVKTCVQDKCHKALQNVMCAVM